MTPNFLINNTYSYWQPTDFSKEPVKDDSTIFATTDYSPFKEINLKAYFNTYNAMEKKLDGKQTLDELANSLDEIGLRVFAVRVEKVNGSAEQSYTTKASCLLI